MTDHTPISEREKRSPPSQRPPGGPEALVGVTLSDRYKIVKLIGEGGMGAVYQAEHAHMHKKLAVKVLHPEMSRMGEVVARFEREALAASHIEHPNVAAATDFGKLADGSFFLVLEFIEGLSLRDELAKGPLEVARALKIARQIASALGRAHALGIVHRDLKPENVMLVEREGDRDFVKVLDFGIAKVPVGEIAPESKGDGQVLTQLGMVYGTPEYMAPEQALGQEVDGRADLYALGVMLYEMLAGKRPFETDSKVTLLGMHVTAPIPKVSDKNPAAQISGEVDQIIRTMMAKEAKARFASAKELIDAIDRLLGAPSRLSMPERSAPSLPEVVARVESAIDKAVPLPTTRRNKVYAVGGALAFTGIAGVMVLVLIVRALAFSGTKTSADGGAIAEDPRETSSARAPELALDDKIALLTGRIEHGDAATAVGELEALAAQHPQRADVHRALCKAYIALGDREKMVREAGAWGAIDAASLAADDKTMNELRAAALDKATQEVAWEVLEARAGSAGPDVLYDLAYGSAGRGQASTIARAKKSLANEDVKGRMSPALAVTMQIRLSTNICDSKGKYFAEAKRAGDQRTIEVLTPYLTRTGCGFLSSRDCFPCLRAGDDSVDRVINAIRTRQQQKK